MQYYSHTCGMCVCVCTCVLCIDVERVLCNEDKPVEILARWGPYRDQVHFCLRQYNLDQGRGMYFVSCLLQFTYTTYCAICTVQLLVTR